MGISKWAIYGVVGTSWAACGLDDEAVLPGIEAVSGNAPSNPLLMPQYADDVAFQPLADGLWAPQSDLQLHLGDQAVVIVPTYFESEITFTTEDIRRGQLSLLAPPTPVWHRNIASLYRGNLEERFTAAEWGLSQTWHFATRPPGTGDLVVSIRVAGYDDVTVDGHGFTFGHSDRGVSYSHAVWVDDDGAKIAIDGTFSDGVITFLVPDAVIRKSRYPAALDPTISAEIALETMQIDGSPTSAHAVNAALASTGAQYLAVWRDERISKQADIFATRLSTTGARLETNSIAVATDAGVQDNPAVTAVGTGYLVVWEDTKLPVADADLRAAVVSSAGAVTSLGAFAVTAAAETRPRLAGSGSNALIVFERSGGVYAARYNGTTIGAAFVIAASAKQPSVAALADGSYIVAFAQPGPSAHDIWARRVTSAGAVSGAAFTVSAAAGEQLTPSVALIGGLPAVAFASGAKIMATRIGADNTLLDTRLEGATTVGGKVLVSDSAAAPELACAASCILTWTDRRASATQGTDIYARAFNATLTATAAEVFLGPVDTRPQTASRVAAGTSNFIGAWTDSRDRAANTIYATALAANGTPTVAAGDQVPRSANRQSAAWGVTRVVGGNSEGMSLWTDSRTAVGDNIHAQRISNVGGATGAQIVAGNGTNQQHSPIATFDGTNYLSVWSDARTNAEFDIYAARITPATGAVQDPTGIAITTATKDQFATDIVGNGAGRSLLVWHDRRAGNFDIYGAFVLNGSVVVANIPITTAANDQLSAAVSWDSVNNVYLVVWSDARPGTVGGRDIYGARVSATGTVLDPGGVVIANATGEQFTPTAVYSGGRFVVAWDDRRSDTGNIYGARVRITAGGLIIDDPAGIAYSTAAGAQTRPRLSLAQRTTTTRAIIVWNDERNSATNSDDIWSAVINPATGARVGGEFVIANTAQSESRPHIAGGTNAGLNQAVALMSYQRYVPALRTTRAYYRYVVYTTTEI